MPTRPILITGGTVLDGPPLTGTFIRADVLIRDGRIEQIAPDLASTDGEAEVLDATGTFVLPGFVDAHAHLWEASMRGIAADWDILDFAWSIRFNHSALHGPDDLYAGALGGAVAALDAGTTTVLDHVHVVSSPDHADQALRAVVDSGLRAIWCYGLNEVPGAASSFRTFADRARDVRRVREASVPDRIGIGVAPTDILSAPWPTTVAEFGLGRELDALVTAHLNTTWGPTRAPEAEWLHRDGLLGHRQVFSHANASSEHELTLLAQAGAAIASTPESELQMGLGFPIFARAGAAGVTVGLGSDLQANNSPDSFTTMRLARQAENGRRHQQTLDVDGMAGLRGVPVGVRDILHAATLGGATALGLQDLVGSLEPGKAADVVLLRHDAPGQQPVVDPFATVVAQSHVGHVDTVLVAGEIRKRHGALAAGIGDRAARLVTEAHGRLVNEMARRGGPTPPRPEGLLEAAAAAAAANLPDWVHS